MAITLNGYESEAGKCLIIKEGTMTIPVRTDTPSAVDAKAIVEKYQRILAANPDFVSNATKGLSKPSIQIDAKELPVIKDEVLVGKDN